MKSFIFITNEGFTFQPGSDSSGPDIDNCQVIGFSKGVNMEDAFRNLVNENRYLLETSFDEVIGYELKDTKEKSFQLNNFRNCSIFI